MLIHRIPNLEFHNGHRNGFGKNVGKHLIVTVKLYGTCSHTVRSTRYKYQDVTPL